jgi:hypothetical protein
MYYYRLQNKLRYKKKRNIVYRHGLRRKHISLQSFSFCVRDYWGYYLAKAVISAGVHVTIFCRKLKLPCFVAFHDYSNLIYVFIRVFSSYSSNTIINLPLITSLIDVRLEVHKNTYPPSSIFPPTLNLPRVYTFVAISNYNSATYFTSLHILRPQEWFQRPLYIFSVIVLIGLVGECHSAGGTSLLPQSRKS